jgi:tetratricopeptide (TPR) repeat protein
MSESEKPELPPDSEQLELKLPDESSALKDLGLWAGVLALITLIAFWPATTGGFIWRDDTTSANVRLLGPSGLSQSWFSRWQSDGGFNRPVYQPVTDSAYWIEYRLGGHTDRGLPAPTAFHIGAVIFEAGAAILLWLVLRELLMPGAWFIAAIFALHPLHAEPVSWISQQGVALSGLMSLGAVFTYLMFVKSREKDTTDRASGGPGVDPAQTWGLFAGSAALFLLAILSQPSAIVLPLVIALLLWWKKRMISQDGLLLTPLFLIGLGLWFANTDLHKSAGEAILLHDSVSVQLGAIGHAAWNLLFHLIIPLRFSVLYPHGDSSSLLMLFACLPIVAIVALFLTRARFGVGPFVAAVITTLLLIASLNWFDADRLSRVTDGNAYLAIIPLIAIGVTLISRIKLPGPHPQSVVAACTVVLIILGGLSLLRTYAFESSVALWRDVLKKDSRSSFAEANLAEQLRLAAIDDAQQDNKDAMKQDVADAIAHATSALNLDPANGQAQRTWANVLVNEGDIAQALPHFESALRLDVNNPRLREEYASALIELGRFRESLKPLDEALGLDLNSSTTHRLIGIAYVGMAELAGTSHVDHDADFDRASHEYQTALQLDPKDLVALQKLAELDARQGNLRDAFQNYLRMMQIDPLQSHRADLWIAIAKLADREGKYADAVQYLQEEQQKYAPDDENLKKQLDIEIAKLNHAAATRAATMPATTRAAT